MVFTSTLSKIKLEKMGLGRVGGSSPGLHSTRKSKLRKQLGVHQSVRRWGRFHRKGLSLTLDQAARTQPPSFIEPLDTSSEVLRPAVSA